jgi:hypothetical protein
MVVEGERRRPRLERTSRTSAEMREASVLELWLRKKTFLATNIGSILAREVDKALKAYH